MKVLFILFLPLSMALSCGNSKEAVKNVKSEETTTNSEETMAVKQEMESSEEFIILLQEAYGGLENNEQRVIKNAEGLQEVYTIINKFRRPGVPVPQVDFKKNSVVALFMGEKTTGGFSTEVASISRTKDGMIVNIKEEGPKPNDNVTTAICQPFCFVKIPRPDEGQKVIFKKAK